MSPPEEILAIVPARGGSKGIPGKNLVPVAGKPLLVYTLEQAHAAPSITRLVVSTDSPEIAAVAEHNGAEAIRRPDEISGDEASSESALLHCLEYLKTAEGYEPDLVVFLQATSPLRQATDIERAIATMKNEGADSLFSACTLNGFVWRVQPEGPNSFSYDHRRRPRRQEAPEDLLENGSIYIFKPRVLRRFNNRLGGRIAVYRMSPLDSLQVDEPSDLGLIESLMTPGKGGRPLGLERVTLLALDFDGVMTDNRVIVDESGKESVLCDRGDGLGIARLKESGLDIVVISKEANRVVTARCKKLKIPCSQSVDNKRECLEEYCGSKGHEPKNVAYLGNDLNDLDAMKTVGLPIAVADARPEIRKAAAWITSLPGGRGAVREVCEALLAAKRRRSNG